MDNVERTARPSTAELHPQLIAPSLVYVTGEDFIRLVSWNSLAGVKLTARLRILDASGRITMYPIDQTPNTDRTAKASDFTAFEGWLLGASVEASSGAPARGQTFAMLKLMRGTAATSIEVATIAADYVTSQQRLAYPGSGVQSSLAGQGFLRSFTGTDPAAGAEISETVPAGARWRFQSLHATLVTDATVATRNVQLLIDDGATTFHRGNAATSQAASLTFPYTFSPNGQAMVGAVNNAPQICTPVGLVLLAGWRIRTLTANVQATDNYGAPQLALEEWLEAA